MEFAGSVKIINAIFACVTSSSGWPLYHVYPFMSKCLRVKLLRIAAYPQKLNLAKIKAHTVSIFHEARGM